MRRLIWCPRELTGPPAGVVEAKACLFPCPPLWAFQIFVCADSFADKALLPQALV